MPNRNEIIARGRVVNMTDRNENQKLLTVFSMSGKPVYIRFFCDSNLVKTLKPHSRVEIKGHAVTSRIKNGKKNIVSQNFIADEISPEVTMTEKHFGIKGKFFEPLTVKVLISGVVSKVVDEETWIRFSVDTADSDEEKNIIPLNMKKVDRQPNIEEGDKVYVVCGLSSPKKNIDGNVLSFEDLIVLDIAVEH